MNHIVYKLSVKSHAASLKSHASGACADEAKASTSRVSKHAPELDCTDASQPKGDVSQARRGTGEPHDSLQVS